MITSTQNNKIKNIVQLKKSRERKKQNLIVVEGHLEIKMAEESGLEIVELFVCDFFIKQKTNFNAEIITEVDKKTFEKIAFRENPDGYLALVRPKVLDLEKIKLSKNPLVIILEAVEKPGNLGAILRTADAAKVDAVIINDVRTDIYNPNVIRASLGTVFTNQVVIVSLEDTLDWLKKNKITSYAAALPAKNNYLKVDYKKPSAIILGTEHEGLSDEWLKKAEKLIKIPMKGQIDSLNVSVSAAVIIFEANRQRNS